MSGTIIWNGKSIPFESGETVAQALMRVGVLRFGATGSGQQLGLFCGIGQCQPCLVEIIGGSPREACLTPCRDGLALRPIGGVCDV